MWILYSDSNPNIEYTILIGTEYIVGRKDCQIILQNDLSISRKHAVIWATATNNNNSTLHIKDVSKLGTQLKNERICNGSERILNHADVVIFGSSGLSKFKVVQMDLVLTTSCLPATFKKDLRRSLFRLGGQIVSDWTEKCQFVVMETIVITAKVVCALLSEKYLVTPNYFTNLINSILTNNNRPKPSDYLPILSSNEKFNLDDISFEPNSSRKNLFIEKEFLFLSGMQYKRLVPVLQLASTKFKLISNEAKLLVDLESLKSNSAIVIMPDQSEILNLGHIVTDVVRYLKRNNLRIILEAEIGYAVIHNSISIYCNPRDASLSSTASSAVTASSQISTQMSTQSQCTHTLEQDATLLIGLENGKRKSDSVNEENVKKIRLCDPSTKTMKSDWLGSEIDETADIKSIQKSHKLLVPDSQNDSKLSKQQFCDQVTVIENTQDQNKFDKILTSQNLLLVNNSTVCCRDDEIFLVQNEIPDSLNNVDVVTVINDSLEETDILNVNVNTNTHSVNELNNEIKKVDDLNLDKEDYIDNKLSDLLIREENIDQYYIKAETYSKIENCSTMKSIDVNQNVSINVNKFMQNNSKTTENSYMNVNRILNGDWCNVENLSNHKDLSFELIKDRPIKVVVVETKSLLRTSKLLNQAKTIDNTKGLNFKKFKSKNTLSASLPHIIGGRELVAHKSKSDSVNMFDSFNSSSRNHKHGKT